MGNENHGMTDLGYLILMDRYAYKTRGDVNVGDLVIALMDNDNGDMSQKRELATVVDRQGDNVTVELQTSGNKITLHINLLDKPLETTPASIQKRVAKGIASAETTPEKQNEWQDKFEWLLGDWKFVPGGRILATAGTGQKLTSFNCFVIPHIDDSRHGIFERLEQMAEIMSRGGGVGINISTLRPKNAPVLGVNGRSSGSVSWGALYSYVTGLIEQNGSRRGALMIILNDWHPDIFRFIESKKTAGNITNANISVGISDEFMQRVKNDDMWYLKFPDTSYPSYDQEWDGNLERWENKGYPVIVYKEMPARELWGKIVESAWASAEPGLWFRDRANKLSNSYYYDDLIATNPCGEQGLPGFGICNLGALNLSRFVTNKQLDESKLRKAVRYGVRFLDNVIDDNFYFMEVNKQQQMKERRVGLGIMGLAEMLILCEVRYGSEEAVKFTDNLLRIIAEESYLCSAEIAREKGSFPAFDTEKYLASQYMLNMSNDVRDAIRQNGARNVTLLTVAPTGTTGTMLNTSTGIEPFFSWAFYRKGRLGMHEERIPLAQAWIDENNSDQLPPYFVTAMELSPFEHVTMMAAAQRWVDSSISKCVTGDTLVMTDKGLIPIASLSEHRVPDSFEALQVKVKTPQGWDEANEFYFGGLKPTIKLELDYGFEIEGTPNHRIHTLTHDGTVDFKQLGDITSQDTIVMYKGQQCFGPEHGVLPACSHVPDLKKKAFKPISFPTRMSEDFAYWLGAVTSEGDINKNGVRITNGDKALLEHINDITEHLFGIRGGISPDSRNTTVWYLQIASRRLRHWLLVDLELEAGANNKIIPNCILQAAPNEISQFLRGLFLDAYVTKTGQSFGIGLSSSLLIKQLQVLLLNYGIVTSRNKTANKAWTLNAQGESLAALAKITSFDEVWKNERIAKRRTEFGNHPYRRLPAHVTKELSQAVKASSRSLRASVDLTDYQHIRVALNQDHRMERTDAKSVYNQFKDTASSFLHQFMSEDNDNKLYLSVKSITSGMEEVYDIAVPDSHSFIANGFCNHNTVNCPNDWSIEQVSELYMQMYDLGCKGGTIYRDGSRNEQVLTTKPAVSESKPENKVIVSEPKTIDRFIKIDKRDVTLRGKTLKGQTPYGSVFITINEDDSGAPFEVFITIAKSGSDLAAQGEALGRLISTMLQMQTAEKRVTALKMVVQQLRGIGGSRPSGFGANRVASFPDAVAKLLEESLNDESTGIVAGINDTVEVARLESKAVGVVHIPMANTCPECHNNSLLRQDGCEKCGICGYSAC